MAHKRSVFTRPGKKNYTYKVNKHGKDTGSYYKWGPGKISHGLKRAVRKMK